MLNKEIKFKFIIQRCDQTVELTIEEAEKLYNDLAKIFAHETTIKWYPAEPIPYSPPTIPQNPNPWPEQPYTLPTIITCNLNAIN